MSWKISFLCVCKQCCEATSQASRKTTCWRKCVLSYTLLCLSFFLIFFQSRCISAACGNIFTSHIDCQTVYLCVCLCFHSASSSHSSDFRIYHHHDPKNRFKASIALYFWRHLTFVYECLFVCEVIENLFEFDSTVLMVVVFLLSEKFKRVDWHN